MIDPARQHMDNSVGGFLDVPGSGRDVRRFNAGWRFMKVNDVVIGCQSTRPVGTHMPRRPVVFENAFRFCCHGLAPQRFEAEGLIGGEVVSTHTIQAWDRRHTLTLDADTCGISLQADGADFIAIVVRIVDKAGQVVRLTDDTCRFTVTGPAEIVEGADGINPQRLIFGEAVALVRAGTEPGEITVRAESAHPGVCKPLAAELSLASVAPVRASVGLESPVVGVKPEPLTPQAVTIAQLKETVARLSAEVTELKAAETGRQQEEWA